MEGIFIEIFIQEEIMQINFPVAFPLLPATCNGRHYFIAASSITSLTHSMADMACRRNNATLLAATAINPSDGKCIINNLERLAKAHRQDLKFWLNNSSRQLAIPTDFQDRNRSREMAEALYVDYVACEKGE